MDSNKISEFQLTIFIACSITASGITVFREMFRKAEQDAWLGFYLPMVYAILIVWLTIYISRGEEEKNILQLNKKILGQFGGNVINFLVFFYILLLVSMEVNKLANFIKYFLLPKTPVFILAGSLLLAMTYFSRAGIEVIVRFGTLVTIPFASAVITLPFMLFNELEISNLLPIAANGSKYIFQGSFSQFALFGEIFLIALVLGNTSKKQVIFKHPMVRGTILGAFLLTFFSLMNIITVGVPISSHAYSTTNYLVQLIHIAEFMDRFDVFMLLIWLLCGFIRIVFFYYLLGCSLSSVGKEKDLNKDYFILFIPLILVISQLFFRSQMQTFNFQGFTWQILTIGFQVSLVLILVVKKWIRRSASYE